MLVVTLVLAAIGFGLLVVAWGTDVGSWSVGTVVLGAGTSMVYPVLLAAVSDVATPRERASRLGVYRFWRDVGLAVGGVLAGVLVGSVGVRAAIGVAAALTAASGIVTARWLGETRAYPARSTG